MMSSKNMIAVKPFQETLYGGYCGPASLKMVLDYYGTEISEEKLADLCGRDPDLGTSSEDLKRVATELEYKVTISEFSTYEDIESWLTKGVPVIVNWFTRGRQDYNESDVPDGHYSVVIGLDDQSIYLQDPEIGKMRILDKEDFYRVWFDFSTDHITSWEDMIVRQLIAIEPNS